MWCSDVSAARFCWQSVQKPMITSRGPQRVFFSDSIIWVVVTPPCSHLNPRSIPSGEDQAFALRHLAKGSRGANSLWRKSLATTRPSLTRRSRVGWTVARPPHVPRLQPVDQLIGGEGRCTEPKVVSAMATRSAVTRSSRTMLSTVTW